MRVTGIALLFVALGLFIDASSAAAGNKSRKTWYSTKVYKLPKLPTSKTTSKSQPQKSDDDDRDKPAKSESKVADKSKAKEDEDDDQEDKDEKVRGADGNAKLRGDDVPATVADLLKRLFANPSPQVPMVDSAVRKLPPKADLGDGAGPKLAEKPTVPSKPLQKVTGRPVGDLNLRLPSLPNNDVLVRNISTTTLSKLSALGIRPESRRDLGVLGSTLTRLVIPPGMNAAEARALLKETDPSARVDLNQRYRLYPSAREGESARPHAREPARTSGGCTSDRCYGAATIGWQEQLTTCAKGLNIGVVDTGIDSTHPSLAHQPERFKFGQFGPGYRGSGADLHGTGVLALLAGSPKSSTPGLIPNAKFYVADIFFADENGQPVSTTLHLLEALEWMDHLRVQIINLSLSGPRDDLVQAAITRMSKPRTVDGVHKPAVIFIAAAGNGGPGAPPSYPAAYPEAIAVTAVNRDLRGYRRANQGDYIDVAAPGVDIWTALPDGRQGYQTGTSFAVPFMTAIVASLYHSLPPSKSRESLLQRISIQDLGQPGPDPIYGRGLVQAPVACGGPSTPWTPAVVARARPLIPAGQKTASR